MGSHTTQAIGMTFFLLAFIALAAAMAGVSLILYGVFLILFGISVALMLKCKAMEDTAE